jgi:hypothetical protein
MDKRSALAFALAAWVCHAAVAAEVGSFGPGRMRGIGFYRSDDSQFALRVTATGGDYRDDSPTSFNGPLEAAALEPVPVGGYGREQWRLGSPYGDHWSARFTTTLKVAAQSEYTLYYTTDDGARLWIDDKQLVNDWVPRPGLTSEAKVTLTAGGHVVRAEFFESGGSAQAHLLWSGPGISKQVVPANAMSSEGKPGWKAEYFLNEELKGEATADHSETLSFNWGEGGPAVFGGGPPVLTLDWARLSDGVVVGHVRGPAKTQLGITVESLGRTAQHFQAREKELAALPAAVTLGAPQPQFRLRALNAKATVSASNPADAPGVWSPGDEPLVFLAGTEPLPDLDAKAATRRLQQCMSTGLAAPFPPLGDDGWASLFNGKDLAGWRLRHEGGRQSWSVRDGALVNDGQGTDLYSDVLLTHCELHVEFLVPKDSNSGVYLQGRYEVQIHDSFGQGLHPGMCGAIYSKAAPSENACKPPGGWQTLDILFRGARPAVGGDKASNARATVVMNGMKIIDDCEIDGVTGGAMDDNECSPHGIMLQGDHGPVQYRGLRIRPLK